MATKHQHLTVSKWFFLIGSVLVLYLFWRISEPFVLALITAAIAAVILSPLDRRLRKLIRARKLTAFLLVLGSALIVVAPLFVVAVLLVDQAEDVLALIQRSFEEGGALYGFTASRLPFFEALPDAAKTELLALDLRELGTFIAGWLVDNLGAFLSSTVSVVINMLIFFIALYYFLADRERFHAEALKLSPFRDKLDEEIIKRIIATVRGVVFGALIIAIIQGILAAIGMAIFGVPGALVWGALVVIAAEVPILGVGFVIIPAVAYLFLTGHPWAATGLAAWGALAVGLVDNFLSPHIIGSKAKLHSLFTLVSILGGIQLLGPIGLIIGPTVLAAIMVVIELYKAGILENGAGRKVGRKLKA